MAAESLAYVGDARAVPDLVKLLDDRSAEVRYWTVFALGQLGDASLIPTLQRLRDDTNARQGSGLSPTRWQRRSSCSRTAQASPATRTRDGHRGRAGRPGFRWPTCEPGVTACTDSSECEGGGFCLTGCCVEIVPQ